MQSKRNRKRLKKAFSMALSFVLVFACALCTANINANTMVTGDKLQDKTYDNKFPVHITYHNLKHVKFMSGGTVSDALNAADITLSTDDVINVSGETAVSDGMQIIIDEVKYIKKTDTEIIRCDTKVKKSDDYPRGYEEVVEKGKNGKQEVITTYKYVNGEYSGVCGKISEIVSRPKTQVVLKGTQETIQASNLTYSGSNEQQSTNTSTSATVNGMSYSKVLKGSATAYTASSGALTSTGVQAFVGGVAVNPNVIPYGSKLYIVADGYTYGYATAVDTGGALMDGSALVDLYMATYDECINFGRRDVTVYILS